MPNDLPETPQPNYRKVTVMAVATVATSLFCFAILNQIFAGIGAATEAPFYALAVLIGTILVAVFYQLYFIYTVVNERMSILLLQILALRKELEEAKERITDLF